MAERSQPVRGFFMGEDMKFEIPPDLRSSYKLNNDAKRVGTKWYIDIQWYAEIPYPSGRIKIQRIDGSEVASEEITNMLESGASINDVLKQLNDNEYKRLLQDIAIVDKEDDSSERRNEMEKDFNGYGVSLDRGINGDISNRNKKYRYLIEDFHKWYEKRGCKPPRIEYREYLNREKEEEKQSGETENKYFFKLTGDIRRIKYEDEIIELKEVKGFKYIEYLITHSNIEISSIELYSTIERPDTENEEMVKQHFADTNYDNVNSSNYKYSNFGKEYLELLKELEDIEHKIDLFGNDEELQNRKDEIINTIYKDRNVPATKCRIAVTNAVRRAINKIDDEQYPKVHNHLKNHIKTGAFLKYSPDRNLNWDA
jgi:hypothetical protein